jgi:hypothetical protein
MVLLGPPYAEVLSAEPGSVSSWLKECVIYS